MDPRIIELLERLAEVSDDQLADLEDIIVASLEEAAETKDVDKARSYAEAVERVRNERAERLEQARAREEEIKSIMSRVHATAQNDDDGEESDGDEGSGEEGTSSAPASGSGDGGGSSDGGSGGSDSGSDGDGNGSDPTASASNRPLPKIADLARNKRSGTSVKVGRTRSAEPGSSVLTVAIDVPGMTAGTEISDREQLRKAILARYQAMAGTSGLSGNIPVVRLSTEFTEERLLRSGDEEGNWAKLDKVISPQALVASGGICAPGAGYYDMLTLATAERPLRGSLPRFGAERGAIRFIPASSVADVTGAIDVTTEAEDAAGPTKACLTVVCDAVEEVTIQAISRCLQFGNFNARTHPEGVTHTVDLTTAAHAREAESQLWEAMCTASTAVTAGENLSAWRDVYASVVRAASQYRSRHRMGPDRVLRFVAPAWLADLMSVDLVRQLPGDGTISGVTRTTFESWLRNANIMVTWTLEGGEPDQVYGTQGAGGLLPWNSTVETLLFAEGTFLFLDGGTLDIGIVRDSTLNQSNDFQMFAETFEAVAQVGNESLCLTLDVCPSGLSSGQNDSFDPCTLGS